MLSLETPRKAVAPPGSSTDRSESGSTNRTSWFPRSRSSVPGAAKAGSRGRVATRAACFHEKSHQPSGDTCPRAGWIGLLAFERLRNAVQPTGSRTHTSSVGSTTTIEKTSSPTNPRPLPSVATCTRAGWISTLRLEWLRNAVQPPGPSTHCQDARRTAVAIASMHEEPTH